MLTGLAEPSPLSLPHVQFRCLPVTSRQALDTRASSLMLFLCALWGLQQVMLKATAADIAPIMQIALRCGAAAVLLSLWMWWRKERMRVDDGTLRPGLLVASLFAVEFLLLGEGLRHTSAAHAVVFLYTAPIFVALGLHLKLPSERPSSGPVWCFSRCWSRLPAF